MSIVKILVLPKWQRPQNLQKSFQVSKTVDVEHEPCSHSDVALAASSATYVPKKPETVSISVHKKTIINEKAWIENFVHGAKHKSIVENNKIIQSAICAQLQR